MPTRRTSKTKERARFLQAILLCIFFSSVLDEWLTSKLEQTLVAWHTFSMHTCNSTDVGHIKDRGW